MMRMISILRPRSSHRRLEQIRTIFKVAIVGSGPSGCYTAKYLLAASSSSSTFRRPLQIDVVERLPTPYGLVRYGVAPDHPAVKNVQNDFDALFSLTPNENDNDSDKNRIRFFGNVRVGETIQLEQLRERYHAVVLAYGCESDQHLPMDNTPPGIVSAREFVAWYNGHPDYALQPDMEQFVANAQHVVVVGQGNVALDCARILTKGSAALYDTDITSNALRVIGKGPQQVSVVGRRGLVQGAFTVKELRELTQLPEANFVVNKDELNASLNEASQLELEASRPRQRIWKLLEKVADQERDASKEKEIHLRFLLSPSSFLTNDDGFVSGVVCERTRLDGEPGKQKATGTGEFETLPADLVLVSIGYKGEPIHGVEGFYDAVKGVIRNQHGKVDDAKDGMGGLYVSGWIKRGPTGIIGTNISDAKDTVASIVHDLTADGAENNVEKDDDLRDLLEENDIDYVTWEGYQRLDTLEKKNKRSEHQPREKIVDLKLQLEATKR